MNTRLKTLLWAGLLISILAIAGVIITGISYKEFGPTIVKTAPKEIKAGVFFPETFTLRNGLSVVVVTNRRTPLVTQMVWYKVGSADEPPGKSGIAHVLEHLMFKGTATVGPGQFSKMIAQHGGRDNAFTSRDYTSYHQVVAKDQLETALRLEADRMAHLALTDDVVIPELQVVLEERRMRTENDPGARLGDVMQAALFVNHPYGTPIIGWEKEIARLTRADAEAFYRSHYGPNNAILILSGDINADEARPLVEKYYGPLQPRPLTPRVQPDHIPLETEHRILLQDPLVSQPSLQRTYRAPSFTTKGKEHAYALHVLAEILGGGPTSRLYRNLVMDKKVAVAASASYDSDGRLGGTFSFGLIPRPEVSLETAEQALLDDLSHVLAQGLSDKDVREAATRLKREAVFARDSAIGPAYVLGAALATGQTVEDVEAWPERISAVTPVQVAAAAQAVLGQKGVVTGILLPEKK